MATADHVRIKYKTAQHAITTLLQEHQNVANAIIPSHSTLPQHRNVSIVFRPIRCAPNVRLTLTMFPLLSVKDAILCLC